MSSTNATTPTGISHVRLTVTDIHRSKEFYGQVFGVEPAFDFSDEASDPDVLKDPAKLYGGCVFAFGDQLLGLRPVAEKGDTFESTRVGLDHVALSVGSVEDLDAAAERLDHLGVVHGEVKRLEQGMAILSLQDPDDINLELSAPLPG